MRGGPKRAALTKLIKHFGDLDRLRTSESFVRSGCDRISTQLSPEDYFDGMRSNCTEGRPVRFLAEKVPSAPYW